ncbi:hypothetical protein BOSEA1005_11894 [Hyphomicrobiales bacterium]|nr:hypothetical protein BOSEA1005_11894 [Hyphomicrobiales bacterium]
MRIGALVGDHADPQRAAPPFRRRDDMGFDVAQLVENAGRVPDELAAGARQCNAARQALEEKGAHLVFDRRHLPGQGGLRDIQSPAGGGDTAVLSDGQEILC